ncbi:MAG: glycosyltransferase, partial [Bacteroidia bacterium]
AEVAEIRLFHFPLWMEGEPRPEPLNQPEHWVLEWHPVRQKKGGAWARFWNANAYQKTVLAILEKAYREHQPDGVHVHAPDKTAAPLARFLHGKTLPLFLTEHWAIYDGQASDAIEKRAWWFRRAQAQLWKRVDLHLSISQALHGDMQRYFGRQKPMLALPNVVNQGLFYPHEREGVAVFLHVSGMDERKNPKGILRAFSAFRTAQPEAQLCMLGADSSEILGWAQSQGLAESVQFIGACPQAEVAVHMRQALALVLFSFSENAPCVISEALCSGVPVLSTSVGAIPEMLPTPEEGLLLPVADQAALTRAFEQAWTLYKGEGAVARYGPAAVAAALERGYGL